MAESETARIRSFVAVDLEAPVVAALQTLQAELAAVKADVRWVRPAGLHVTLKFLGAVEASVLERVRAGLVEVARCQTPLFLRVRGLGAFPSLRRPRVLWVGLDGAGLVELAAQVDERLAPLGFAREKRPFTPHVTLGRVNGLRGWPRVEEVFKAHLADDFGASAVGAMTVYRSTLRPDGAVYTALWTIPFNPYKEGVTHGTGR
jgi:2'-5' RNA ligase